MKHRFEFLEICIAFRALVKTQHFFVIKCFWCDLGKEYTFNKFLELLASDGTMQQTSCTDTPKQNVVAERKHRHIVETAYLSYCRLLFLVNFGETLFLLL